MHVQNWYMKILDYQLKQVHVRSGWAHIVGVVVCHIMELTMMVTWTACKIAQCCRRTCEGLHVHCKSQESYSVSRASCMRFEYIMLMKLLTGRHTWCCKFGIATCM